MATRQANGLLLCVCQSLKVVKDGKFNFAFRYFSINEETSCDLCGRLHVPLTQLLSCARRLGMVAFSYSSMARDLVTQWPFHEEYETTIH